MPRTVDISVGDKLYWYSPLWRSMPKVKPVLVEVVSTTPGTIYDARYDIKIRLIGDKSIDETHILNAPVQELFTEAEIAEFLLNRL